MNKYSLIITYGNEKNLTIVDNLLVFLKGQAEADKEWSEVERQSPSKLCESPKADDADGCDNNFRSALSLVACCCVDKQFSLTYSRKEQTNCQPLSSWQPVKSFDVRSYLQEIETVTQQLDRDQRQKFTKVGIFLNKMADSLPYCGFIFDVYIINPSLGKESRALTLAALHRLREWHGAAVTVVQDPELAEGVKDFSLFSPAIVQPDELSTTVQRVVWRGSLFWPGEQTGLAEAGASLACHNYQKTMKEKLDALYFWKPQKQLLRSRGRKKWVYLEEPSVLVFGRQLEVVDCVSVESVPLYVFDSFHLTLYLDPRTRFGRMVQVLSNKDAFLMRLAVFEKKSVPEAADIGLTTHAWKDGVTSNATGMPRTEPENQPVHGREHLILLVPGGQEKVCCLRATVLLSSCEINPQVFEEINRDFVYNFTLEEQEGQNSEESNVAEEKQKKVQNETVDEKIVKTLCHLPVITDSDFLFVEQGFRDSLTKFMQEEKARAAENGEDFELTTDDLEDVVQLANGTLLKLGQPQDPYMAPAVRQAVKPEDFIAFPDNLTAPSEWPERKLLMEIEAKEKALPRTQSTDSVSLLMSSPLNAEDGSLDTKDLLPLFDPDGTNDRNKLQPIMLRLPKHKYVKDEDKSLPWPECRNLNYHDIYYEHIEENRKLEEFYQKFRDDILLEETHHVCAERPHIPAVRIRKKKGGKSSNSSDRRLSNEQKSMMDVTCGGSKLTPIHRSFSSSSTMPPTTPSEKHRRENEQRSSSRRSAPRNLRRMSSLTDDSPFFAPQIPLRRTASGRLDERDKNRLPREDLNKSRQCVESRSRRPLASPSGASPSVCGPAYQLTSSSSSPALTFRKATPRPDTVHIFMPPSTALTWSGQAEESAQGREVMGTPGCAGDATSSGISSLQDSAEKGDLSFLSQSSAASCGVEAEQKSSSESKKSKTADQKLSRKERHMKKLEAAVSEGLSSAGVGVNDIIYTACFDKLAFITKFYAKQLPTSRNLKEELQKIVQQQVLQVVDLERRRQDMAMKNKLRKSSLVGGDKLSSNSER